MLSFDPSAALPDAVAAAKEAKTLAEQRLAAAEEEARRTAVSAAAAAKTLAAAALQFVEALDAPAKELVDRSFAETELAKRAEAAAAGQRAAAEAAFAEAGLAADKAVGEWTSAGVRAVAAVNTALADLEQAELELVRRKDEALAWLERAAEFVDVSGIRGRISVGVPAAAAPVVPAVAQQDLSAADVSAMIRVMGSISGSLGAMTHAVDEQVRRLDLLEGTEQARAEAVSSLKRRIEQVCPDGEEDQEDVPFAAGKPLFDVDSCGLTERGWFEQ